MASHNYTLPPSSISPDRRAVKSAQALRGALLELLAERPLDRITVMDITERAGVHRGTFSRHYPNREALLDHVAAEEVSRVVSLAVAILDQSDGLAAARCLLEYVGQNRPLWNALLTGAAAATRQALFRCSMQIADERAERSPATDLTVRYSTALVYESLSWWVGHAEDQDALPALSASLHRVLTAIQSVGETWDSLVDAAQLEERPDRQPSVAMRSSTHTARTKA